MQQRVEVEAEATQGAGASDVGEEKMRQLRCGSEQGAQADHVAGDDVGGWAHLRSWPRGGLGGGMRRRPAGVSKSPTCRRA